MWQGVMKAWNTIQSGLEQQDPTCWAEIIRQPIYGNRYLTNEIGVQWGTETRSSMVRWMEKGICSLKELARPDGQGWLSFAQQTKLWNNRITMSIYNRLLTSLPWENNPPPALTIGQWVASKEEDGTIRRVLQITGLQPVRGTVYHKDETERLQLLERDSIPLQQTLGEVRVVSTGGPKNTVMDFNPKKPKDDTLWLWGGDWIQNLGWDPKEWQWRRIGILPETNILNYTTKRGYRTALRQNNHQMRVDAEMEAAGFNSKTRAKNFNRIWHPYLPRKVFAMQWLILTEGLPVGAWRERIGLPNHCQLCPTQPRETLQHAFQDCTEITRAWDLFRALRAVVGLPPSYSNWKDISRGLMTEPAGPSMEEDLRWDTAAAFTVNMETPWDILRAQLLWSIWCRRVEIAFREEHFHIGAVIWHAWRNTIYAAMEAYKELFRHVRNEEKRQELISCFQKVWTAANIFGRMSNGSIRWNLTPPSTFLPADIGAWNATPIHIHRPSPSPDIEAEFAARPDFDQLVEDLIQEAANQWQPHPLSPTQEPEGDRDGPADSRENNADPDRSPSEQRKEQLHHTDLEDTLGMQGNRRETAEGTIDPTTSKILGENNGDQDNQEGKENNLPPPPQAKTSSRPKRRCYRRPRHPPRARILEEITNFPAPSQHASTSRPTLARDGQENRQTLQPQAAHTQAENLEIERPAAPLRRKVTSRSKTKCFRKAQQSRVPTPDDEGGGDKRAPTRLPKSRHKVRCRFGPNSGRRKTQVEGDHPSPSTPHDCDLPSLQHADGTPPTPEAPQEQTDPDWQNPLKHPAEIPIIQPSGPPHTLQGDSHATQPNQKDSF